MSIASSETISYRETGYFSSLILDYLNQHSEIKNLYNRFPDIENFKHQIQEKQQSFSQNNRNILVQVLKNQYQNLEIPLIVEENIKLLGKQNTFTIVTGHQLNLFTGPLYFLYKIISTINLCKELKNSYPDYHFIPIYWMATEDHDFEEINHFSFENKTISWNKESTGPVGRLSTKGLEEVFKVFENTLGLGENADKLKELFKKTYLEHNNLTDATRYLANKLFQKEGLVIVDGDSKDLKELFIPYVKKELMEQVTFKNVSETIKHFDNYGVQVNPRDVNLFYIEDTIRKRISKANEKYKIIDSQIEFTEIEIFDLLEKHPEKFSPNVLLRPLYQEIILPNLCYIGGGGEIAYWLELKNSFKAFDIPFPMLLLRNSVLLASKKQNDKMQKLNLSWQDLFKKQQTLINEKTKDFSQFSLDFSEQKEFLKKQFERLTYIASKTDKSFIGAVKAQETKQLKGLENLEKRLLKAEKKVHSEKLDRIIHLQNELFPNQSLQERKNNFSEFYKEYGNSFIERLLAELEPLEQEFKVLVL